MLSVTMLTCECTVALKSPPATISPPLGSSLLLSHQETSLRKSRSGRAELEGSRRPGASSAEASLAGEVASRRRGDGEGVNPAHLHEPARAVRPTGPADSLFPPPLEHGPEVAAGAGDAMVISLRQGEGGRGKQDEETAGDMRTMRERR
eukprot:762608-Hanusia_phi.AAC.3